MSIKEQTAIRPRVLILGATGRIGRLEQVEAWRHNGKDAVLLDLDRPETFPDALSGIGRIFLATGYTVAMVHQSKTIVDAAADAGVKFIVHLGIFGNGRVTYDVHR
jgi:uncharacterized protein YbjT (DUF2867 family)